MILYKYVYRNRECHKISTINNWEMRKIFPITVKLVFMMM